MGFKNNYSIEITEIRHLDITIEASTEKEALAKARMNYIEGNYVIDKKDIVAAEFEVVNSNKTESNTY